MKKQANQSQNKSFKPTPIPHRTKSGEPMAYYILSEDGAQEFKVPRAESLPVPKNPKNPFHNAGMSMRNPVLLSVCPVTRWGKTLHGRICALYGESKNNRSGNFNVYGKAQTNVIINVKHVRPARAAQLNLISHWVTILMARIHFTNLPIPLISQNF